MRVLTSWRSSWATWLAGHSPWIASGSAIALAVQPLLHGLPRGHDTLLHLYRIPLINALWQQGVVFSRWIPDLLGGCGYPLFAFYPPLSAYLSTVLYWVVGENAPLALILTLALTVALAGVSMYLLGRELYAPGPAAVAAAAYVLSPHLLYQIYARGSISNALAMALFPLAAWLMLRLVRHPSYAGAVWAALALAAIVLTHAAASLVVVGPLIVIVVIACFAWSASPQQAF